MVTEVKDIPTPATTAELAEVLDTHADLIAGDPQGHAELIARFKVASDRTDPDIEGQVKAQVEATFAQLVKDDPEIAAAMRRPPLAETPNRMDDPRIRNPKAIGAGADGLFDTFGDYLEAVYDKRKANENNPSKYDPEMAKLQSIQAAYSTTIPAEGGALVPEEFRSQLLQLPLEDEIVKPRATVIPMSNQTTRIPAVDDTNRTSSTHGGIITYWTKEAGALTASEAEFKSVRLEARKLTAYAELPSELPMDAPGFQAFIMRAYPEALAWGRDVAFLEGSGTDEPLGVFNTAAAGTITQAKETSQTADTIDYANVLKMFQRMLPRSHGRAVWLANIDTFAEIMQLELSSGSPAVIHSNIAGAPPFTLLGRPLIFTEKVATLGDKGDIAFCDFSQYLVGDRQAMSMATSTEFKFNTDELAFRVIERLDGRPWMSTAVTPRKGANTLSAFVQLAARA